MSKKTTISLFSASLLMVASQVDASCTPDGLAAEISDLTVHPDGQFAEFRLIINNQTAHDLGGAIIELTLTAKGRPSPLAESVSQLAHTLEGGLLAGETTSMREVISISEHAAGIIAAQVDEIELQLDASISAAADVALHPIGGGIDPFQLWSTEASPLRCR